MSVKTIQRFALLCVCLLPLTLSAQGTLLNNLGAKASAAAATTNDPYNRSTPRLTLMGFLDASQKGDTDRALNYLELNKQEHDADGEKLVRDLTLLLNRAYVGHMNDVSDQAAPSGNTALKPNQEQAGEFSAGGHQLDLILVRVTEPGAGYVWLVSWQTLANVPEIADNVQTRDFESRHLPGVLVSYEILNIPLWIWLWFVLMLIPAWIVGNFIASLISIPFHVLRGMRHGRGHDPVASWRTLRSPVVLLLASFLHGGGVAVVRSGIPLLLRMEYGMVLRTVLIFAVAWLFWKIASLTHAHTRATILASGEHASLTLVGLGHKLFKSFILIAALFAILANAGINLTTVLAGLGIGGIAVALAAQKSLENLFGGVSVLSDQAVRVGDFCDIGGKSGTVEDIGLRSTRIRSSERTEISIPNGALATMSIENLSMRDKRLFNVKLGLVYETTETQLQKILVDLRQMLTGNERIEQNTFWVRFTGFGESALTVEIFAYILTKDNAVFLAAREELLFEVMRIVESNNSAFAFPTRTVYLSGDEKEAK